MKNKNHSSELFEIFSSIASEGLMIHVDGVIQVVNKAFAKLTGYSGPDDLVGKKGFEAVRFTPESQKIVFEHIRNNFTGSYDIEIINLKGKIIPVETRGSEILYRGQKARVVYMRDITERRIVEERFRESVLKYRSFVEQSYDGFILINEKGVIIEWNKSAERITGMRREEAVGSGIVDIQLKMAGEISNIPEYRKRIQEGFDSALKTGEGPFFNRFQEFEVVLSDGSQISIQQVAFVIKTDSGNHIGTIIRDITTQKKAEKALKDSEEQFKNIIKYSPTPTVLSDLNDKYLLVNNAFTEVSGLLENESIGKSAIELGFMVDENAKKYIMNEMAEKGLVENLEVKISINDVKTIDVLYSSKIIQFNNNPAILHILIDITKRKLAESALQESEERFRDLSNLLPQTVFETDLSGNLTFINKEAYQTFAYSPDDFLLGLNVVNMVAVEFRDVVKQRMKTFFKEASSRVNEYTALRKDGTTFPAILYSNSIIRQNRPVGLRGILFDISELKKLEEELKKHNENLEDLVRERTEEIARANDDLAAANEELNAINEELQSQSEELQATFEKLQNTQSMLIQSEKMASIGVLAAGVAHEINNPLNFINGGLLYLDNYFKDNLNEKYEETKPVLEAMNTGVMRAADIVKSLSHYTRNDTLPETVCDVHEIMNDCLLMLKDQHKKMIDIRREYCKNHSAVVGNEGKLHQVFLNVFANAFQAIEGKGEISITTKKVKNKIKISITDSGHGISKEHINRIFDPFFTTHETGKGTGLGLSIVYNIVKEHNGSIEIESQVGIGTKVKINFPLKRMSDE